MKAEAQDTSKGAGTSFSPQQLSQEQLAVAFVIDRIAHLSAEATADLAALGPELARCQSREEFDQITEAIKEVIFPGMLGKMRHVTLSKSERLQKWKAHFAKQLKELRTRAKLTQEQLAERAGLPQSHISRLEKGMHSPSRKTVEKIARALDVETRELDVNKN